MAQNSERQVEILSPNLQFLEIGDKALYDALVREGTDFAGKVTCAVDIMRVLGTPSTDEPSVRITALLSNNPDYEEIVDEPLTIADDRGRRTQVYIIPHLMDVCAKLRQRAGAGQGIIPMIEKEMAIRNRAKEASGGTRGESIQVEAILGLLKDLNQSAILTLRDIRKKLEEKSLMDSRKFKQLVAHLFEHGQEDFKIPLLISETEYLLKNKEGVLRKKSKEENKKEETLIRTPFRQCLEIRRKEKHMNE